MHVQPYIMECDITINYFTNHSVTFCQGIFLLLQIPYEFLFVIGVLLSGGFLSFPLRKYSSMFQHVLAKIRLQWISSFYLKKEMLKLLLNKYIFKCLNKFSTCSATVCLDFMHFVVALLALIIFFFCNFFLNFAISCSSTSC